MWRICPLGLAKGSFPELWALYFVLTMFLDEMLDIVIYGSYAGKLQILWKGCYVWWTSRKQNLRFDSHYIANIHPNHTTWLDFVDLYHVRTRRLLETNMNRRPFCLKISFLNVTNMGFQLSFTSIYPCKQANNIRPTYCKSRDSWKTLQPASIPSRIHLE